MDMRLRWADVFIGIHVAGQRIRSDHSDLLVGQKILPYTVTGNLITMLHLLNNETSSNASYRVSDITQNVMATSHSTIFDIPMLRMLREDQTYRRRFTR